MNARTYASRIKQLRATFQKNRIDAFVLFTHEDDNQNVRYLSGFGGTMAILVVTRGNAFIGVDSRYTERARREAPHFTAIHIKPLQHFSDIISEAVARDRSIKKIAYEGHRVSVLTARSWGKRVRQKLVPLDDIVGRLRQLKGENEIAEIKRACQIASKTFGEIRKRIRPGMKETDIARDIDITLLKRGAVSSSFPTIVASGPNAAIPHHEPGARKLKKGDPVVMDFGARVASGYCSDITRTVFVPGKRPHPEMKKIYGIVLGANRRAFRALKPGMAWKGYDAVARSYIKEQGYGDYFTHGLGHSLGLDVHDPFDYREGKIRVGTVFTNEPGIYLPGKGGVRIEDDIAMTRRGPVRLTTPSY